MAGFQPLLLAGFDGTSALRMALGIVLGSLWVDWMGRRRPRGADGSTAGRLGRGTFSMFAVWGVIILEMVLREFRLSVFWGRPGILPDAIAEVIAFGAVGATLSWAGRNHYGSPLGNGTSDA